MPSASSCQRLWRLGDLGCKHKREFTMPSGNNRPLPHMWHWRRHIQLNLCDESGFSFFAISETFDISEMLGGSVFSVDTLKGSQHTAFTLDNTPLGQAGLSSSGISVPHQADHQLCPHLAAVASARQLQLNCPHLTFSSGAELSHCEQSGNQSLFTNQLSSAPC